MKAKLYPTREPDQRCLDLISALYRATHLGQEAIYAGEKMYSMQYSAENPLVAPVSNLDVLPELKTVCSEAGIVVEVE